MQTIEVNKNNQGGLWNIIWSIIWIIALVFIVLKFTVYQQVTVVGESMEPFHKNGEGLIINQLNKSFKRGQVVAVYEDEEVAQNADYFTRFSAVFFLKRIIGLPGESIEIIGSTIIIYNQENPGGAVLVEDYIPETTKISEEERDYYYPKTQIPEDEFFVMGDNRSNSTDSRSKGSFPSFSMFGQETLKFWPITSMKVFDLPNYSFEPVSEELRERREELKNKPNRPFTFR